MNKYERKHLQNLEAYQRLIEELYNDATTEVLRLYELLNGDIEGQLWAQELDKLIEELNTNVNALIVDNISNEWQLANNANDALVQKTLGINTIAKLSDKSIDKYFNRNTDARDAFINRKEQGLNLSQRVWKYTQQFESEINTAIQASLLDGTPANELARNVKQYLNNPNACFRRVRDEQGNLHLSNAAKNYHPGQGVYRSSYKNAMRLARTELNMAYRNADYERIQSEDFVVGTRVVLSNNHPQDDICNSLSAPPGSKETKGIGCYPKDFRFSGWHPHCRCHIETILKTDEELMRDNRLLLAGREPLNESVNMVTTTPQSFKDFISRNESKFATAKSTPYWYRDNKQWVKERENK